MLLCLEEQDFNIPANLVQFEGRQETQLHGGRHHHLVFGTLSITDDEKLHRNAIIFGTDTYIHALVASA